MLRLLLLVAFLIGCASFASFGWAQPRPAQEAAALILARREAVEATRRSARLEQEAARATDAAAQARAEAEAIAARIEAAEADITAAETRIRIIEGRRAEQRARLAERQAPIVRLTAALQVMARRPPALALIQPGSTDDVVHVRSLLATTLPVIRARTAAIRDELARAEALRRQAEGAVAELVRGQEELRVQRTRLAQLEVRQRERSANLSETALAESDRALAFGEEARDLGVELGDRRNQARIARMLQGLPGPVPRPVAPASPEPSGGEPRFPGYRLAVQGRLLTGTGELSDAGVHARGLTLEVAPAATVVSPGAGRIAYASRFRSYGEIVVIEHPGGWSSVVTNLATRMVENGDRVDAGDAIGRTGPARSRVSIELRREGRPVPITDQLR